VGLLKQSLAIVGGAGKGTAEVAKQIGLEQVFGQVAQFTATKR